MSLHHTEVLLKQAFNDWRTALESGLKCCRGQLYETCFTHGVNRRHNAFVLSMMTRQRGAMPRRDVNSELLCRVTLLRR